MVVADKERAPRLVIRREGADAANGRPCLRAEEATGAVAEATGNGLRSDGIADDDAGGGDGDSRSKQEINAADKLQCKLQVVLPNTKAEAKVG